MKFKRIIAAPRHNQKNRLGEKVLAYVMSSQERSYLVLAEQQGNRLYAFRASTSPKPGKIRRFNLERHGKMLGQMSDALNAL
jgi:hypothetical protein